MSKEKKQKIDRDKAMRDFVKPYDSLSGDYFSITHIAFEGGINSKSMIGTILSDILIAGIAGGLSFGMAHIGPSDWSTEVKIGMMTANHEGLAIYEFKQGNLYTVDDVVNVYTIAYKNITKIKQGRLYLFFGKTIKLWFMHEQKKYKIKISIPTKINNIKYQKSELIKLIDFFKNLKNELKDKNKLNKEIDPI